MNELTIESPNTVFNFFCEPTTTPTDFESAYPEVLKNVIARMTADASKASDGSRQISFSRKGAGPNKIFHTLKFGTRNIMINGKYKNCVNLNLINLDDYVHFMSLHLRSHRAKEAIREAWEKYGKRT